MANEVLTAGTYVKYCVEVSGKPTSGYTVIPNIKVTPDITGEPEAQDVTDLSDLIWRRYISGLKDPGGAVPFTANLTGAFITAWETLVSAYATAKAAGKAVWFEIQISGISKSFYFTGEPVALGIDGKDVGAVAEQTAYIVVNNVEGWGSSST